MRVSEELDVSAEDFFNEIMKSVIGDVQKTTNKKIHSSQIKPGLNYKKLLADRFSSNQEVTVKVLSCIPNKEYSSVFMSKIDKTTTKYKIEELSEFKICVTYTEEYDLIDSEKIMSKRFLSSKYIEKQSLKKAQKLLRHIEKYILTQRGTA